MAIRDCKIINKLGLHARASAKLTQTRVAVTVRGVDEPRGRRVNAKSIMGVMMLAAGKGSTVTIETDRRRRRGGARRPRRADRRQVRRRANDASGCLRPVAGRAVTWPSRCTASRSRAASSSAVSICSRRRRSRSRTTRGCRTRSRPRCAARRGGRERRQRAVPLRPSCRRRAGGVRGAFVDLHRADPAGPAAVRGRRRDLIRERRYNAEWALTTQLQAVGRAVRRDRRRVHRASARPTSSRWSSAC